jgi:hypothetical protein
MRKANKGTKTPALTKSLELPFTPTQFEEFLSRAALGEMRLGHEAGHAIAAKDALVFCKHRNLAIPDWASNAIVMRDHFVKKRKGQKPAELQYRQYLKDTVHYLVVRCCEYKHNRNKEKRLDKFGSALELLDGSWAQTKEVTGLKKSFYEYKKKWRNFYVSYIFYRLAPKFFLYPHQVINQKRIILFDLIDQFDEQKMIQK